MTAERLIRAALSEVMVSQDVASLLDCSGAAVSAARKAAGLPPKKRGRRCGVELASRDLARRAAKHLGYTMAGRLLGTSKQRMQQLAPGASTIGVGKGEKRKRRRPTAPEAIRIPGQPARKLAAIRKHLRYLIVQRMWADGASQTEIGEILGVPGHAVAQIVMSARREGYSLARRRAEKGPAHE